MVSQSGLHALKDEAGWCAIASPDHDIEASSHMTNCSSTDADLLERDRAFEEQVQRFFRGESLPREDREDYDAGPSCEEVARHNVEWIEAEMANIMSELEANPTTEAEASNGEQEEPTERIEHEVYMTRFDKVREKQQAASHAVSAAEPNSSEWHAAMSELARANVQMRKEMERDADPVGRFQNERDRWRSQEGRKKYNASRRKRKKPNDMTPKAELEAMTDAERAAHDRDQSAKRVWVYKQRKKGKSEAQIEVELEDWWARRLAKKSG
jgi:flagellar hook-basal body complex protein FliE